jgi:folate-binding Fe-S cluster repair protein YgfZ
MGFILSLLIVACSLRLFHAFNGLPWTIVSSSEKLRRRSGRQIFGSFDYEYIAPNQHESTFTTDLPSSYPLGTPAGLRGEAIRSALRSDRCLGWNLQGTPLEHGVVQVKGPGTLSFLNNKLTQSFPSSGSDYYTKACLLTAKGRLVDRVGVAVVDPETAYITTSAGHTSHALMGRLEPFIFPMDQVSLVDCGSSVFTLASVNHDNIQKCFDNFIYPKLGQTSRVSLPKVGECRRIPLHSISNGCELIITPSSGLASSAGAGYTFLFLNDSNNVGDGVWRYLVSDSCPNGPIEAGALEFETLRIQSGQPAFGREMTGRNEKEAEVTPASPLELCLQDTIDPNKGCYLGQEGVASLVKNPRGPPRTLNQVIFDDDFNVYDYQSEGEMGSKEENLTRIPMPGDKLYALGSNEEILLGYLTSVAEPGSTGDAVTLALALIRRSDSILKQLKLLDIEIPSKTSPDEEFKLATSMSASSILIPPPPLDPLDGLEVIVGGTFTIGALAMVPSRRRGPLFEDDVPQFVKNLPSEESMRDLLPLTKLNEASRTTIDAPSTEVMDILGDEDDEATKEEEELLKAIREADEAAAEAKRKAEKMELLRKRAEEAVERRKRKGT